MKPLCKIRHMSIWLNEISITKEFKHCDLDKYVGVNNNGYHDTCTPMGPAMVLTNHDEGGFTAHRYKNDKVCSGCTETEEFQSTRRVGLDEAIPIIPHVVYSRDLKYLKA